MKALTGMLLTASLLWLAGCATGGSSQPPQLAVPPDFVSHDDPDAAFWARAFEGSLGGLESMKGDPFEEADRQRRLERYKEKHRRWLRDEAVAQALHIGDNHYRTTLADANRLRMNVRADQVSWYSERAAIIENAGHWHADGAPEDFETAIYRHWERTKFGGRFLRHTWLEVRVPVDSPEQAWEVHSHIGDVLEAMIGNRGEWYIRRGDSQAARYRSNLDFARRHLQWLEPQQDELANGARSPADLEYVPAMEFHTILDSVTEREKEAYRRRAARAGHLATVPPNLAEFRYTWGCHWAQGWCNSLTVEVRNEYVPVQDKHDYAFGSFYTRPTKPEVVVRIKHSHVDEGRRIEGRGTGEILSNMWSGGNLAQGSAVQNTVEDTRDAIVDMLQNSRKEEDEKARRVEALYAQIMPEWRASEHYGRHHDPGVFLYYTGAIYSALGYFFDHRNESAKATPYWRDGAEEAARAGVLDIYLGYRTREVDSLLSTGRIDRARLTLEQTRHDVLAMLARDSMVALRDSEEVHDSYYYLVLEDLALRVALQDNQPLDFQHWHGVYLLRDGLSRQYPRLDYMDHMGIISAGVSGMSEFNSTNIENVRMQHNPPTWEPLFRLGEALSRSQQREHRQSVADIIPALHQRFDVLSRRIERWGMFDQDLSRNSIATRNAVRAGFWRHYTEGLLRLNLGETGRAATAAAAAAEAYKVVDDFYDPRVQVLGVGSRGHLPGHLRALEGIERNEFDLVLLQARIDESLGKLDQAAKGYVRSIAWAERNRDALPLRERQHFFRSVATTAYLGRLRVAAQRYRQAPDDTAMLAVLDASEQFRSRQLQELLGTDASGVESVARLQSQLGAGDLVLMINDLDSHLMAVVLTPRGHRLNLVEKPGGWDSQVFAIRDALAGEFRFRPQELRQLVAPLLADIEQPLQRADGLYVLVDGALSVIPASILPLADGRLLQGERPLRYLPTLAMLDGGTGPVTDGMQRSLFAMGDPLYDREAVVEERIGQDLLASTRSVDTLGMFIPLPETRDEVTVIADAMGDSLVLLGAEASESAVKTTDLSPFRYLHFATHGVLGEEVPELGEPALVLSYEEEEDGFLTASEVAALDLNAELTVLSACNTGSGEYFRGEGLMGLGRAFMVAGSRQVLVSLWPVESFATKSLMLYFYAALNEGLDAASALARAQQQLRATDPADLPPELRSLQRLHQGADYEAGYGNPFFWSPFVLIGTS